MPNHVTNIVIIKGFSPSTADQLKADILNQEGEVDFGLLLPIPLNAWMGSCSTAHEQAFRLTALDWCAENWGTKWNAYQQRSVEFTDEVIALTFDTAWRPPYGWLAAVFNKHNVEIAHHWLDEGRDDAVTGSFLQIGGLLGGPSWSEKAAHPAIQDRLNATIGREEEAA